MTKALISDIKRFAVHDGDGIRTTVFFKGCSLKCVWCHNPESISLKPQLAYYGHKCTNCGSCTEICEKNAHVFNNEMHSFKNDLCIACGKCIDVCLGDALKLYGKEYTVQELLPILTEDRDFYENSGGGVTLSGGECLLYADFCAELLKKLKLENINTAVDTCGFVSHDTLNKVIPYTDVFLYDIKAFDENVHIKCTGKSNKTILQNLKYLDECGKKIEIRIPYVPEYNSAEMHKILDFLKSFNNITRVRILPYHNYAVSKYEALYMKNTLPKVLPVDSEIEKLQQIADKISSL